MTQINDYFPFGLQFPKACGVGVVPENRYKFNGIEHIAELELDMAAFRSYDAAIGRWMQVDPLAELMPSRTPFRFGFNNPISWSDPWGLFETRKEAKEHKRKEKLNGKVRKQV